jgi:hypothetical protein
MTDKLYENMLNADVKPFSKRLGRKSVRIFESSIDFARDGLDPAIWAKGDDTYTLKAEAKQEIFTFLKEYPGKDLIELADSIHIVGSIASNQYDDDADIDVHIVPKDIEKWDEQSVREVQVWFNEHRDEFKGYIGNHPIEVYIQTVPEQDLMSMGVYDINQDEWLVGPSIVPEDYDPYEDFSHIADEVKAAVKDADAIFGELKRDIIDYDTIKQAMGRLSGDAKQKLLGSLQNKLKELEDNIGALYSERGEWVAARRSASKPESPQQALQDVELARKWRDANAVFKFVNRYQYLKIIDDLEKLLDDGEVSPEDVDKIKDIVGEV